MNKECFSLCVLITNKIKCTWLINCRDNLTFLLGLKFFDVAARRGHSTFFSSGVRPGFPKCGVCERTDFCLWKRDLENWNVQIWGLRAKMWAKIKAVEAKISIFSQRRSCKLIFKLFYLKWDPCELRERCEKGIFRDAHSHAPFLGQCPRVL